jgi:hypothetical protein
MYINCQVNLSQIEIEPVASINNELQQLMLEMGDKEARRIHVTKGAAAQRGDAQPVAHRRGACGSGSAPGREWRPRSSWLRAPPCGRQMSCLGACPAEE